MLADGYASGKAAAKPVTPVEKERLLRQAVVLGNIATLAVSVLPIWLIMFVALLILGGILCAVGWTP
jgi:hypothetical protein